MPDMHKFTRVLGSQSYDLSEEYAFGIYTTYRGAHCKHQVQRRNKLNLSVSVRPMLVIGSTPVSALYVICVSDRLNTLSGFCLLTFSQALPSAV